MSTSSQSWGERPADRWNDAWGSSFGSRGGSATGGMQGGRMMGSETGGMSDHGPYTGRGPKGYTRADDRIREEVCEALTRHGHVDASEIEVAVEHGEVTLKGSVPERQQKRLAEDIAESVSGVKDVRNEIRATGQSGQMTGQGAMSQGGTESGAGGGRNGELAGAQGRGRTG
ncbi:MAG: BON domain-containing protein [Dehalococcoidia bacterium]